MDNSSGLVKGKIADFYVIGYIEGYDTDIRIDRRTLAEVMDIGTVKLANELAKFNGIRLNSCFAFEKEEDVDAALEWAIPKYVAYKLGKTNNRPNYGYPK